VSDLLAIETSKNLLVLRNFERLVLRRTRSDCCSLRNGDSSGEGVNGAWFAQFRVYLLVIGGNDEAQEFLKNRRILERKEINSFATDGYSLSIKCTPKGTKQALAKEKEKSAVKILQKAIGQKQRSLTIRS